MQTRIEPPILMSRLMTFVMATSLVVLFVLILTLDKMFPLNRPQVFFLTSQSLDDKEFALTQMPENMKSYQEEFVRNYVLERNEIVPDLAIMRAKWANNSDGIIKTRSSDAIFGEFVMTDMVYAIRQDLDKPFDVKCDVEFDENGSVLPDTTNARNDTYIVKFTYVCNYGNLQEQPLKQHYALRVKVASNAKNALKWTDRIENPLGIRVVEYNVIDKNGKILKDVDPLNWSRYTE